MLGADFEASLLILDFPRADRCTAADWDVTLNAFRAACAASPAPGTVRMVVSSLAETMPEAVASALLAEGIVPAAGLAEALRAIAAAASIGEAWGSPVPEALLQQPHPGTGEAQVWDEVRSKAALAAAGVPVPKGRVLSRADLADAALPAPFPLVCKAVGADLAHKTEVGGVALGLTSREAVVAAADGMAALSDQFLIEEMASGTVAELIVGVARDPQFGLFLTLGAGGVFVELLRQTEQVLLPASRVDILAALARLPLYRVLTGYRGKPACDMPALVDAITAIASWAMAHADRLEEMDVNPLLALPTGAMAVDALIRMREPQA
jgi:acetyl-CoA synthetase